MLAELAFAHDAIKAATREVRGADFRYAKTLTLPFFGSGMVDLPPGGEKRVKNSRKMQMVFFVFSGRVLVDVAGTTFSVGRGGMWQVPRGKCIVIFFALIPRSESSRFWCCQCMADQLSCTQPKEAELGRPTRNPNDSALYDLYSFPEFI